MQEIEIGHEVVYVSLQGEHLAAIVSHVYHDDVVRLHILMENGIEVNQQVGYAALNEEGKVPGNSWHWYETGIQQNFNGLLGAIINLGNKLAKLEQRLIAVEANPIVVNNHPTAAANIKTVALQVEEELGKRFRKQGFYREVPGSENAV